MVERFFRDLTHNRLRAEFPAMWEDLINATDQYVHRQSDKPKPFIWTASTDEIVER